MQKRIVCFGDSNTWGLDAATSNRFSETERWPCLLQQWLSDDFQIVEEGLNGRTSVSDDPLVEGRNAFHYIHPCLHSHAPLELVIMMLGTNDVKERFSLTAYNIAQGITRLAHKAKNTETGGKSPKVLVVAPPVINSNYRNTEVIHSMGENCDVKSKEIPPYLSELLAGTDISFLDASQTVSMGEIDYMHLDQQGHKQLAELIFKKINDVVL